MASSKYVDSSAIVQVIGCTMKDPSLLEDDRYFYNEADFANNFHRVVFGAINNLYTMGAKKVSCSDIEAYFENRPESKAIYYAGKGSAWLTEATSNADLNNFDY